MPNKILIPLQSLISFFLEHPENSGCNWGTLERLHFGMSQRDCLLGPSSCYPGVWEFFCPYSSLCQESGQWKLWAAVRYLANFLTGYDGDSLTRFSHCFFLLSFSSLPELKPSQKVRGAFVRIQREAMLEGVGYCRGQGLRPRTVTWIGMRVNSYANEREGHPSHWGATHSFWQCLGLPRWFRG